MFRIRNVCLGLALLVSGGALQAADYVLETWADGLDLPWSIAFLPGGGALVTELGGTLRPVTAGGSPLRMQAAKWVASST